MGMSVGSAYILSVNLVGQGAGIVAGLATHTAGSLATCLVRLVLGDGPAAMFDFATRVGSAGTQAVVSSTITATGVGVGMATAFITSFVVKQAANVVGSVVGSVVGGVSSTLCKAVARPGLSSGAQDGFTGTLSPGTDRPTSISTLDLSDDTSGAARDFVALLTFDFGEEEEESEAGGGDVLGSAAPPMSHVPLDPDWTRDIVVVEKEEGHDEEGHFLSDSRAGPCRTPLPSPVAGLPASLHPSQTKGLVIECRTGSSDEWRVVTWDEGLQCYVTEVEQAGGEGVEGEEDQVAGTELGEEGTMAGEEGTTAMSTEAGPEARPVHWVVPRPATPATLDIEFRARVSTTELVSTVASGSSGCARAPCTAP